MTTQDRIYIVDSCFHREEKLYLIIIIIDLHQQFTLKINIYLDMPLVGVAKCSIFNSFKTRANKFES